jgi:two-component system response regulator NreC
VLVGQGISALFRASGEVASMSTLAGDAVQCAENFLPHVAMVDVSAGSRTFGAGTSGVGASAGAGAFEMAAELVQRSPQTRLLVVDEEVHPLHVHRSLHVGGAGYWTKHTPFDQLFQAVKRIAAGQWCFCPEVREQLIHADGRWHLRPSSRIAAARLTNRESQVMTLLAEGLSVKQCAERLKLSPHTIDNHKSRLMGKLGLHKMSELVRLAMSRGMTHGGTSGDE